MQDLCFSRIFGGAVGGSRSDEESDFSGGAGAMRAGTAELLLARFGGVSAMLTNEAAAIKPLHGIELKADNAVWTTGVYERGSYDFGIHNGTSLLRA